MKNLFTLLFLLFTLSLFSQTFKKGDAVQIEWKSKWYNGKIIEVKGDQYLISYDGYDASWNETVGAERLKMGASTGSTTTTNNSTNESNPSNTSYRSVETIWDLAMSPDGKYILAASAYGKLVIINVSDMSEVGFIKLTNGSPIFTAAWSPDGDYIATGFNDGNGMVYARTEGMQFTEYDTLEGYSSIFKMRFHPKKNLLMVSAAPKADYRNTLIDVWDIQQKKIKYNVLTSTNENHSISDMEWNNDGSKMAVGISNKKKGIQVYDSTGKMLYRIEHAHDVTAVSFSPDGGILATGGIDGKITLWNLADKKQIWSKAWRDGVVEYIGDIAFAPNGLTIAVCGRGTGAPVKTYKLASGSINEEFGKTNPVGNCVLFSSDSKNIFVAYSTYGDISKVPVVQKFTTK